MQQVTLLDLKIGFGINFYVYIQILRSIGLHGGQHIANLVFKLFFPNRGLRPIRVLILHQREGYTEAHTKREATPSPAGRRSQWLFANRVPFSSFENLSIQNDNARTFFTVFIMVFRSM